MAGHRERKQYGARNAGNDDSFLVGRENRGDHVDLVIVVARASAAAIVERKRRPVATLARDGADKYNSDISGRCSRSGRREVGAIIVRDRDASSSKRVEGSCDVGWNNGSRAASVDDGVVGREADEGDGGCLGERENAAIVFEKNG